jgi:hypothetical protein
MELDEKEQMILMTSENHLLKDQTKAVTKKPHTLSACLWAAESFKTRGVQKEFDATRDMKHRLVEWIDFHLMVGFDHIYLYDMMLPDKFFLEAYNCDSAPAPKPSWADRAKKQLYRSNYTPYRFVQYSTVKQGYAETFLESRQKKSKEWKRFYSESQPSEQVTDKMNEATMIHMKGADEKLTSN